MTAPLQHVYMVVDDSDDTAMGTFIGHTTDIEKRTRQHNGELPGGPRVARKTAGHWKIALIIPLPPHRDLAHAELAEYWKRKSRKANCRLEFGIEMARKLGLPWFINSALLDNKEICGRIGPIVERYRKQKETQSEAERQRALNRTLEKYITPGSGTDSCNALQLSTGRKRNRKTTEIDFRRTWTGMTSEQRMRLLRNQSLVDKNGDGTGAESDDVDRITIKDRRPDGTVVVKKFKTNRKDPFSSLFSTILLKPAT